MRKFPEVQRSAESWLSCLARGRAAILDLPGVYLPRKLLRHGIDGNPSAGICRWDFNGFQWGSALSEMLRLPQHSKKNKSKNKNPSSGQAWNMYRISAKIGPHGRACIQGDREWHLVEDHDTIWHNEAAHQLRTRGPNWIQRAAESVKESGDIMSKSWRIMEVAEEAANPSICPACDATETDLRPWGIHSTCRCWSLMRVTTSSSARELKVPLMCHRHAIMQLIMTSHCRHIVDMQCSGNHTLITLWYMWYIVMTLMSMSISP